MKICLVFRGENERNYRGYTCSLDNIDNWQKLSSRTNSKFPNIYD